MAVSVSLPATSVPFAEVLPGFFGREAELAWLRRLWDEAAARDRTGATAGPRLAILISETGLGKSRLVQALYQMLTAEPVWNPPDESYWPNTMLSATGQMRANPVLDDHVPKGQPRFLWLGARWQSIDARNVEERTCIIPALRDALYVHVRIAQRHRTIWQRLRTSAEKKIKSEGPDYVVEKALDLTGLPYANLVFKMIKAGASARNAPTTPAEAVQKQREDAEDTLLEEMREVFGGLGGGGLVLPTVLWLDDAHWIDPLTLHFLTRVWKEATENRWPLLVILTHWEKEWNNLRREVTDESLLNLAAQPGAEKWVLSNAPAENIAARLKQGLPGLSPAQHASMLEKAAGNFLTLEENMGELIGDPENFVELRVDGPLTHAGEELVATWASDRQRRIQERFMAMKPKPTLQQLLAWAGRVGTRFPHEVPANFAVRRQGGSPVDRHQLLESCMDPYAVLGAPSPNLLEFRDLAYHAVATEYFQKHRAQSDETELLATLRDTLASWVNGAFDENGNVHLTADRTTANLEQKADRFSNFGNEEKRAVLDIALRELPLPAKADWTDLHHRASLRAVLMYLDMAGQDGLWPSVTHSALRLREVNWDDVPPGIASPEFLVSIGSRLNHVAATDVAIPMLKRVLIYTDDSDQAPQRECGIVALRQLGVAYLYDGNLVAAKETSSRLLQLAELSPNSFAMVLALRLEADVCMALGDDKAAEEPLLRAHGILERTVGPDASETVDYEHHLASVYIALHRYGEAEKLLRRVLNFKLDSKHPDKTSIGTVLDGLGIILMHQSRYEEAEAFLRGSLALREQTLGPGHKLVAASLNNLALVLQHKQGGAIEAEALLIRSLEITERAYGPFHHEVAIGLTNLAEFYRLRRDESRAKPLAIRALSIKEKVLGPDHPDLATGLLNEARAFLGEGRLEDAEPLFLRALSIMERHAGPNLAIICADFAELRKAQGRLSEAEALYKRAIHIFEESNSDPLLIATCVGLGLVYRSMHRRDEAISLVTRALAIKMETLGTGNLADNKEILGLSRILADLANDEK